MENLNFRLLAVFFAKRLSPPPPPGAPHEANHLA